MSFLMEGKVVNAEKHNSGVHCTHVYLYLWVQAEGVECVGHCFHIHGVEVLLQILGNRSV